jgi:hypothetical protein
MIGVQLSQREPPTGASDKPPCRSSDAVMADYGGKRAPHGFCGGPSAGGRAHEQEQRHMDDLNRLPGDAPVAWKKPRGRPFAPGVSGNPKGRPKGARNKATIVVEVLREGEALYASGQGRLPGFLRA